MREIKFRAWHPALKKMFYDCRVSSGGWTDDSTHYCGDNSTIMQYTGLRDKNGNEIYEGDIIDTCWGKALVVYDDRFAGFWLKRGSTLICLDDVQPLEVMGNIYEIPELLETK